MYYLILNRFIFIFLFFSLTIPSKRKLFLSLLFSHLKNLFHLPHDILLKLHYDRPLSAASSFIMGKIQRLLMNKEPERFKVGIKTKADDSQVISPPN